MKKIKNTFAGRVTVKILIWIAVLLPGLSYIIFHLEGNATREFYAEIYRNKMLIINEYTRRVISDVFVAVTHNIYYLEHTLDDPDGHKETMKRIVKSGTRVRSCGISFIKDYYPEKGHRFCPYAWRNAVKPDVIYTEDIGDADLDYLNADWFLDVINSDSAQWSEPFFDGNENRIPLSAYMTPIHDQEGRVIAVVGADVALDWLAKKLEETDSTISSTPMFMASRFDLKSHSYIINHDGTFITHPDNECIMKDNFFNHIESCEGSDVESVVTKMKNGQVYEHMGEEKFIIDGEECYLFYTPVKYTKWILVTTIPCSTIDLLGIFNGAAVVFIIIMVMLFIVIVSYYYIKNGLEPLKLLTKSVNDIAKGRFDTPMPETEHSDEISRLGESIEKMQFSISNYVDDVKRTKESE